MAVSHKQNTPQRSTLTFTVGAYRSRSWNGLHAVRCLVFSILQTLQEFKISQSLFVPALPSLLVYLWLLMPQREHFIAKILH